MPVGIYNLWSNETNAGLHAQRGLPPAWLPAEHHCRWERLRHAKMLFAGKHRQYFLDEERSEFDFPEADVQSRRIRPYTTFNLLRLISIKTADLLFGSKVRLNATSPQQSDAMDLLARRSLLHSRFHAAVVAASWAGGSFLDSLIWRDEAYIETPSPDEFYPIGQPMPDGQYERYTRYATATLGTKEAPITLLLETEYQPGKIVRRLWQLETNGGKTELKLDQWPAFAGANKQNEENLGIAENSITYLPNEAGGESEVSDYDGLIGQQDAVNAKFTQVSRVLAQHADPMVAVPATSANPEGNISARDKLHFFRSKEEIPQYIVWSAQLEAAMADRTAAINSLCMAAEMSQVLLGLKDGAAPDAARKLRLEATNTLAKVGRKALLIEPAIARSIEIAQRLDQTTRLRRSYPIEPIGVEARDGLPVDELDEAMTIQAFRAAGVMSIESGVERRIEDPDAVALELQRLAAERQAATPSIFMNNEPAGGASPAAETTTENAAPDTSAEAA